MGYVQCWAKFITPTRNFPTSYDRNQKLKNLTGHFPTNNNVQLEHAKLFFLHIPNFFSTKGGINIDRGHYMKQIYKHKWAFLYEHITMDPLT